MGKVEVIAHRGASGISPENTMIAFKRAIDIGADAIETDVQMTKDNQLVLIHDYQLERTTSGMGFVKDHTLAELKELSAGNWYANDYSNEKIPTLDELFELVKDENTWLNLEIKKRFSVNLKLDKLLVNKINEYGMQDRVVVSSFNHYSVAKVNKMDNKLKTGILYSKNIYKPWIYANKIKATSLHPHKDLVSNQVITGAHNKNIKVYPYTVDDKEEMIKLINKGVDGLITNVPDRLILLLKEINS